MYFRPSRDESSQTSFPVRKQPPRNKRDQGCQTRLYFEQLSDVEKFTGMNLDKITENKLIQWEAKRKAEIDEREKYLNNILETQRKEHQIEVKKLKKKQWCAMCLKEGMWDG